MKRALHAVWDYFKKLDKLLLLLCLVLSAFGVFLLYTLNENGISAYVSARQWRTQLLATGLGLAAALVIAAIDYRFLARLWWLYAPLTLIPVLLLFTSLGIGVEGADDIGWLRIGSFQFQPSELLKVAFIMTFALHLHKVGARLNEPLNMLLLCLHGLFPAALIMAQGDDGSAMVFLFIFLVMLFAAGLSWKYILLAGVAVPIAAVLAWNYLLQPHQLKRFRVLFDEQMQESEMLGIYYQQWLGKKALGSGQLTGLGIFGSDQYTYVSEIDTDFIFAYIGMTLGFVGCVATIVLLALLCLRLLSDASAARDPLGRFICLGVFAMFLFHSVINIGMVLAVFPVIGIPLPLLSAGGTSVISLYASVGLVLSVYAHRKKAHHLFYEEPE
ncbi:MAG: FtsW/RodA/SpoVE family cell cycle protein [Bacteroides sp.]|nr:FtsW/RodA/SpoVE family cell cycle protein [Eubacterium sp.]MCM1418529.1 FtsW/RodA/SpoVE family cell cycle protein [Roseburia sp.]MCM1462590.1 FtsW/RodA/SpoVE family cell cycle protein [Bacteroides sp.]